MPGRPHHTDEMHSCVDDVMGKGNDESSAYAICTARFKESNKPIFVGAEAGSEEELKLLAEIEDLGGKGSGDFGHAGRPGERGGSSGAQSALDQAKTASLSNRRVDKLIDENGAKYGFGSHEHYFDVKTESAQAKKIHQETINHLESKGFVKGKTEYPTEEFRTIQFSHPQGHKAEVSYDTGFEHGAGEKLGRVSVQVMHKVGQRSAEEEVEALGGKGSGDFGHSGRPGEQGGSGGSGKSDSQLAKEQTASLKEGVKIATSKASEAVKAGANHKLAAKLHMEAWHQHERFGGGGDKTNPRAAIAHEKAMNLHMKASQTKDPGDSERAMQASQAALESSKKASFDGSSGPRTLEEESVGESRYLHLLGATGKISTKQLEGRDHIVVPVIALMEGVIHAVNAACPEFVPISALTVAPQGWNGRPLMYGHPVKNGTQISANDPTVLETGSFGKVFNARVEGKKLLMDAYIDPIKAEKIGAHKMLERIQNGGMVEVSVGAFVTTETKTGDHNGKPYKAIWKDVVPDHLAFLENKKGACSGEMGCGCPRVAMIAEAEGFRDVTDAEFKAAEELLDAEAELAAANDKVEALAKPSEILVTDVPDPGESGAEEQEEVIEGQEIEDFKGTRNAEELEALGGPGSGDFGHGGRPGQVGGSGEKAFVSAGGRSISKFMKNGGADQMRVPHPKDKGFSSDFKKYDENSTPHAHKGGSYIVRPSESGRFHRVIHQSQRGKDTFVGHPKNGSDAARMIYRHAIHGTLSTYAGARHSAEDLGMIQGMHDLSTSMGAYCSTEPRTAEDAFIRSLSPLMDNAHVLVSQKQVQQMHDHAKNLGAKCNQMTVYESVELKDLRSISQEERDKLPDNDFAGPHRSFFIVEPEDVSNAAQSLGRTTGNTDTVKANIIAIAYRKGPSFVAKLPDAWKHKADTKAAESTELKAACSCGGDKMTAEARAEVIKTLVANRHSGFMAGDEKMLEAASDERLEALMVAAGAREKEVTAAAEAAKPKQLTEEDFMRVAPPEIKSLITRTQRAETERKAELVAALKAAQSEFTESELSAMKLEDLERQARVMKLEETEPPVNYIGRGLPRSAAAQRAEDVYANPPDPYADGLKALQARMQ